MALATTLTNATTLTAAIAALRAEIALMPQDNFTHMALSFLEQGFQLLQKRIDAGF